MIDANLARYVGQRAQYTTSRTIVLVRVVPKSIVRTARADKLWYTAPCAPSPTSLPCFSSVVVGHVQRLPALKLFVMRVERPTMRGAAIRQTHTTDLFHTHKATRQ
jgi:hypothetical protein